MIETYDNILPPIIQKDIIETLSNENFSWFLKDNKREHHFEHIFFHNGLINSSFYDIIIKPIISVVDEKTELDIDNIIYAKAIINSNTKTTNIDWPYDVYTLIYCVDDANSSIIVNNKEESDMVNVDCKKGTVILTNQDIINTHTLSGNKKIIMIQFANLKTKDIK